MTRRLVILPLFNEERTIALVLRALKRHYGGDVLVIDDGSTDRSPYKVERLGGDKVTMIRHSFNRGYGSALIEGFKYAADRGYEYAVTMDCDCQHEPQCVRKFFEELPGFDVVSGSRYLPESSTNGAPPPDRRRINHEITELLNKLTGFSLTDSFCGFKGYRVEALQRLALDETGYAFPLQFWIQAAHHTLRVKEIAVPRIYLDWNRSFGSGLDDPETRRQHYLDVINREVERWKITR